MRSRHEVMLNRVPLGSIDPKIAVLDIKYGTPNFQDSIFRTAKRQGGRINRRYLGSLSVTISFGIYEYRTWRRQEICAAIGKWANNGGQLETNDREGQYLQCVCTKPPVIESAKDWTKPLTITFTAYEIPYWQEKTARTATITGSSATYGSLYLPGNADGALVSISATANAAISSVSFTVNGRTLTLSDLSIGSGSVITIDYSTEAIQSIRVGNTSLMDKRSGVDDLLANCGVNNTLALSASASVSATFSARGMWI